MRRVAQIPSGPYSGSGGLVVCCDSDHDSVPELLFHTGTIHQSDPLRIEVWEHQGWNRFSLVYADTGDTDPEPQGIVTGNSIPFAAGDIDDDGLTDVVCITVEYDSTHPDTFYDIVMTLESPDRFSYPCSLSWCYRYGNNDAIPIPTYYPPDLDADGHEEIACATSGAGWCIWENAADNQNALVWRDTTHDGYRLTFGDFDLDGEMNFATATLGSLGVLTVWECTGNDQYTVVFRDTVYQPNGADLFTTNDIDGDGKPEFYVAYENVPRGKMYLYMWEMTGDDQYARTLVDSVWFSGTNWGRISECGDTDGDGIDELIWTTPDVIKVYKAVGDNDLQEVWRWNNDHGGFRSLVSTVYDINGDGYNELITAGNAKISIFEIVAVDLLSPNRGTYNVGDTIPICWVTHTPPRCDSLSLFLRRGITPSPLPPPQGGGNEREGELTDSRGLPPLSAEENGGCTQSDLDTIATGIPGTDTSYRWVVPEDVPDTARVVVIAYGQALGVRQQGCRLSGKAGATLPQSKDSRVAWQFDMSDSAITFTGGGVAEEARRAPLHWSLSVSPNPARGAFSIRYEVPLPLTLALSQREREGVREVMSLGIYDAGGRLVRSLCEGEVAPGRYEARVPSGVLPAGIYFLRLDTPGFRSVKKAVVTR